MQHRIADLPKLISFIDVAKLNDVGHGGLFCWGYRDKLVNFTTQEQYLLAVLGCGHCRKQMLGQGFVYNVSILKSRSALYNGQL